MRYILILAAMLVASPATAQTISGCSSVAANRVASSTDKAKLQADVDCFGRAGTLASAAAKVRADRLAVIAPVVAAFVDCAGEGEVCKAIGWSEVRYGAGDQTRRLTVLGDVRCDNDTIGDPAPSVVKRCTRRAVPAPLLPASIVPIASNFDLSSFLTKTALPPSNVPDVVGAFRIICTGGHFNYDDPILYAGLSGGSPHLHQWFGNTGGRFDSTYASLRTSGDSTCSNRLNRSAYWVPALMNAAGMAIALDYAQLYYKRRPDGDPACLRESLKGCVDLPTGLRAVSGYDMKRMGEPQPENSTFHFRCVTAGKPSEHRLNVNDAVADCGGAGQVMAMIGFGNCWTGTLDSADHRSHLTHSIYNAMTGQPRCPNSHPYLVPELTQGVVWTVEKSDGEVWFSSDRMAGMRMPGGSTFHADYSEAWEPSVRTTWSRLCIGKLLNCSDGQLGDGTMLKRGNLDYRADPRSVETPARGEL